MEDPVSTLDGHTYERASIEEWLRANDTSPSTGETLRDKTLIPNLTLKKAIAEFAADPDRAHLIAELSVRQDTTEPSNLGANSEQACKVELLIVGPSGVGKSSLLKYLRTGEFSEHMDSTVGLDYETQKFATGAKQNCQANVWDSSGQTMFRDTVRTQYRSANVVMFVFDVTRPDTLDALVPYINDAKATPGGRTRQRELILVANKIDLRPGGTGVHAPLLGDSNRAVSAEEAAAFAEKHALSDYREVSARTGANVKMTFTRSLAHAAYFWKPQESQLMGQKNRRAENPGCPCART